VHHAACACQPLMDFAPRYIEDEIAALRAEFEAVDGLRANSEAENKTGFVVSKCESKGAIFIQFRGGSASPVALAEGVSAAAQQGMIFPKFVKRLMPCTKTCYASPEDAGAISRRTISTRSILRFPFLTQTCLLCFFFFFLWVRTAGDASSWAVFPKGWIPDGFCD